jgi:glycosyltransferase involved in cell wall biosynthesis
MPSAAMIMISNFGRSDGGRETWAYNFIPRLLEQDAGLDLHVFGVRRPGEGDNGPELLEAVRPQDRGRLHLHFAEIGRSRLPVGVAAIGALSRLVSRTPMPPIDYTLAVGSFMELLAVLRSPKLSRSLKVAWLRTIYVEEKAGQIHPVLRKLAGTVERHILGKADAIIGNGDDTAAHYRRQGLDAEVIRNAIDVARWHRKARSPNLAPLRIGYVGRLGRVKGINEFAQLARSWTEKDPAVEFHVIGEGPDKGLVEAARDEGKLIFHGAMPNDRLPDELDRLDATVALTFKSADGGTSGLSNALLEQMAAGKIIIAWRNEIFCQILNDQNAYLVEQGSVAGLRRAVEEIIADPADAASRAKEAQQLASQNSFEEHMARFGRLIERAAREKNR